MARQRRGKTFAHPSLSPLPSQPRPDYTPAMPPAQPKTSNSDALRNTSRLAGLTATSRILGFARDLAIAIVIGAGPLADAFFVAFRIPNLLRRLFGEGTLSLAFVPEFNRLQQVEGQERAFAMARSTMFWTLLASGGVCLLCMLFPQVVATLLAPGFVDAPEQFQATVAMVRICAPYGVLLLAAGVSMGVLHGLGAFTPPAFAHIVLNLVFLAALGFAALFLGTGGNAAWALAWALPVAGALQFLAQQPALAKRGFAWRKKVSLKDPAVMRLAKEAPPSIVGASTLQIVGLVATLLATLLPTGSVSWLYYADRLVQLPLGVFGATIGMVALPQLATCNAQGNTGEFNTVLGNALELTLFISLPAAAGLAGLATPIVSLLFGHGAFDATAVEGASGVLAAMALGLPPFAAIRPLAAACCSRQEAAYTWKAGMGGIALFLILAWPLMRLFDAGGLALAMAMAGWANAMLLYIGLRKRDIRPALALRQLAVPLLLSIGVYAASRLGAHVGSGSPRTAALVLVPLLAMGYMLAAHGLGVTAARKTFRLISRRF